MGVPGLRGPPGPPGVSVILLILITILLIVISNVIAFIKMSFLNLSSILCSRVVKEDQDHQGQRGHVVFQGLLDHEEQTVFRVIQDQEGPLVYKEVPDYLEFLVRKVYQEKKVQRVSLV